MDIKKNYTLSKLNTFGINASASFFVEVNKEAELNELFKMPEFKQNEKIFLGSGSNVLFTKDWGGIVVLNKLKGIEITKEDSESVEIRAMGGEIWNDLVIFAVNHNYWGVENLSLVPGTVGAAPMQNIGAYGAELKDTLLCVEAFEIATGQKKIFSSEECELSYRNSIFKNKVRGKYFISAVTLKLSKIPKPNISYRILKTYLDESADAKALADKNKIVSYSLRDISDAVIAIRRSKLPDPKILGNAGSFFKNVFLARRSLDEGGVENKLTELLKKYPEMPHFEEPADAKALAGKEEIVTKIPAGWLIEQCGLKGKKVGNVGVHEEQALVLVNYGGATGKEIMDLANEIIASVKEKFGLELVPEVNLI